MRDDADGGHTEPAAARDDIDERARATWHKVLVDGNEQLKMAHRMFRHLPGPPRCKLCHNPFGGVGGRLVRVVGFKPSRKNPNLCARCCDSLPPGGLELDIAVLFADVRNSTGLGEQLGPAPFAELLNGFYRVATEALIGHDAIVDKLIGDEVMALFIPGIAGSAYRARAADAAVALVTSLTENLSVPVGAAVNAGTAYVGNVGGEGVVDFTALGDAVNTAARLQALAEPGQVVLSADVYSEVRDRFPDASARTVSVRGREAPVAIHVLSVSGAG